MDVQHAPPVLDLRPAPPAHARAARPRRDWLLLLSACLLLAAAAALVGVVVARSQGDRGAGPAVAESLFRPDEQPAGPDRYEVGQTVELGTRFTVAVGGRLTAVRLYRGAGDGPRTPPRSGRRAARGSPGLSPPGPRRGGRPPGWRHRSRSWRTTCTSSPTGPPPGTSPTPAGSTAPAAPVARSRPCRGTWPRPGCSPTARGTASRAPPPGRPTTRVDVVLVHAASRGATVTGPAPQGSAPPSAAPTAAASTLRVVPRRGRSASSGTAGRSPSSTATPRRRTGRGGTTGRW